MIVDCHTTIWEAGAPLGRAGEALRRRMEACPHPPAIPAHPAGPDAHRQAMQPVDAAIVLGMASRYLDLPSTNETVAGYVQQHRDRFVGFAAVDPADGAAAVDFVAAVRDAGVFQGIALSPPAQDFHPTSTAAMRVFEQVCALQLPVFIDNAVAGSAWAKMEYARPHLLDPVAREFPDLRMLIGGLGAPWWEETLALVGKHEHVYADIAGLTRDPLRAYRVLLTAYHDGVIDKLVFGSGFPFASPAGTIEDLYSVNQLVHGTNLPIVPREALRGIVERNALALLGLAVQAPREQPVVARTVPEED